MPVAHIYLAEGFEEIELVTVADVLRRAGVEAELIALDDVLDVRGAHDIVVRATLCFSAVTGLADVIVLPGGGPGTRRLLTCTALHERLRGHLNAGKRVAAICAAPMVLAKAGVLQGREACCYPGCEEALRQGGADISLDEVVTDGPLTTSRGPATAASFALELVRLLVDEARAADVGRAMLQT